MGDDIGLGSVWFCRSAAEYVVYGRLTTLDDSLSLDPNRCHPPFLPSLFFIIFILPKLKRWSVLII
jgi:hypothetical protein